ncbi:putative upstream activation factor subunit spp27-like isoform X2 [Capsicum annuum]|nr:putative upstream activation factor subunit spp27-like isoform X2 [Capsicum annuum]
MVSDSVLIERLRQILTVSDLETATAGTVRRKLEEEFGVDLLDRKAFVRDQIDVFLRTHVQETPNDDVQEVEDVKEEEEKESVENDDNSSETGSKKKASFFALFTFDDTPKGRIGLKLYRGALFIKVVKKIWAYIWEKKLQNPQNKRKILCDDVLSGIFRAKAIDMFQMNKALSKHIWPIDEKDGTKDCRRALCLWPVVFLVLEAIVAYFPAAEVKSSVKRTQKQGREEGENKLLEVQKAMLSAFSRLLCTLDEPKQKEKRQKGGGSGFLAPVRLSDALVKFFGTRENSLPRAEVIKRIWQYIKDNELQSTDFLQVDFRIPNNFGFEAFMVSTRMEGRIEGLWAKYKTRLVQKSKIQANPTKDTDMMAENSYNRRSDEFWEVQPQFREETRPRRLELPLFSSDNPYGWLNRAERYFHFNGIDDKEKLEAAAVCFEGRALNCFDGDFTRGLRVYVARTRRLCCRTRPDTTPVRTLARNSSRIRSNESGDVDQHQEESWLPYRKGETGEGRKSATVIVVAGGRVIVVGISIGKKENSDL